MAGYNIPVPQHALNTFTGKELTMRIGDPCLKLTHTRLVEFGNQAAALSEALIKGKDP